MDSVDSVDSMDQESEVVKYYTRQWIYPESKYDGTHYIVEITREQSCYASMTISDGHRSVYFDLDFDEEKEYNESVIALDTLIHGLETTKLELAKNREIWAAGAEKRAEELREWRRKHGIKQLVE